MNLWPAKYYLDTLLKKMAVIAPKLIYRKVDNEVKDMPICKGLKKKFEDERAKRRDILKLPPKLGGKKKGKYVLTLKLFLVIQLKKLNSKVNFWLVF